MPLPDIVLPACGIPFIEAGKVRSPMVTQTGRVAHDHVPPHALRIASVSACVTGSTSAWFPSEKALIVKEIPVLTSTTCKSLPTGIVLLASAQVSCEKEVIGPRKSDLI